MLNNIKADILNLRGQEVGIDTYFHHIIPTEVDKMEIDIIDVLNSLEQYEVTEKYQYNYNEEVEDYEEELINIEEYIYNGLEEGFMEQIESNNSYNWLSPISNHFNYYIYKDIEADTIIVEFKVHRFGDVRCNYTEECYLEFNEVYEFYEALLENNKTLKYTDNDNIEYNIVLDILRDIPTVDKIDNEGYYEELTDNEAYEFIDTIDYDKLEVLQ